MATGDGITDSEPRAFGTRGRAGVTGAPGRPERCRGEVEEINCWAGGVTPCHTLRPADFATSGRPGDPADDPADDPWVTRQPGPREAA